MTAETGQNFADTVVTNAKIVAMDDDGINDNPGTIAEAMAIKDGEITELGDSSKIDSWISEGTKTIDAKERTVLPGIVDCHSHLHEFAARVFGSAVAPDLFEKHFEIIRGDYETPEELAQEVLNSVDRKVGENDNGEFVVVMPYRAQFYSEVPDSFLKTTDIDTSKVEEPNHDIDLNPLGREVMEKELITKEQLDELAPNNPVIVGNHPTYLSNERARDWFEYKYGMNPGDDDTIDLLRTILFDVFLGGDEELAAEVIKIGQEVYLNNGITMIGTHVYPMTPLDGFAYLDRNDEMDMRVAWGDRTWTFLNPEAPKYHKRISQLHGTGSEFLWNGGVSLGSLDKAPPAIATSLEAPEEVKQKEDHRWIQDGNHKYEALKNVAERGARFACSNHVLGDRAIDGGIKAIVEGSKRRGLSDEEIRERMHAMDHGGLYPRPDQVEKCKKYNIRLNLNMYEPWRIKYKSGMIDEYPESEQKKAENWYAAAKTALDNDLIVGFHGRELENPFPHIAGFVTRRYRGKIIGADQAISRTKALKMATIWNAQYLLRDDLGALKPGNRADFIIIDRDYFDIPKDEIKDITPLMTVVDGETKFKHTKY